MHEPVFLRCGGARPALLVKVSARTDQINDSNLNLYCAYFGAWGSVVVKALRYKSMGPGIDPRWFH